MTEKEKTLLAGCIRGDKASWDAFVRQYSNLVYHTIRNIFVTYNAEGESDLVDDLFQEFFLAIVRDDFKKFRQFRGDKGCSFPTWIRLVARRLTVDFLRKEKPLARKAYGERSIVETAASDASVDETQLRLLSQVLENLTAKDRLLIDLYYRQGLSPSYNQKVWK